jgi:hypothetical protein
VTWSRESRDKARQAKLEHLSEQVSSGVLVIRQMTKTEREYWANRRDVLEAKSTPEELARRETALRRRRQRARFDAQ